MGGPGEWYGRKPRTALVGHSHLFGRGVRCAAGGGDVALQIVGGVGRQTDGARGGQCAARAGALAGGRTRLAPADADVLNRSGRCSAGFYGYVVVVFSVALGALRNAGNFDGSRGAA